jgi:Bacterial extracellular solute-binding proteins, family 3
MRRIWGSIKLWMSKLNWDSNRLWGIIAVIMALILFVLGLLMAPHVSKDWPQKTGEFIGHNWIGLLIIFLVLALTIAIIKLSRDIRSLRKKLIIEEEPKFRRFEKIEKVVYGHIAYRPLLYYHVTDDAPMGVGITLLEKIFGKEKIVGSLKKALWSNLVENLTFKQYDIVATPIFETRERSKHIAFCSPIFYSDIGMYVKKGSGPLGHFAKNSQSFEDITKIVKKMKLTVVAIEGEISGKMALKYLGLRRDEVKEWLMPETAPVSSLISAVNGEEGMECDVAFAEVFQAEQTKPVKKEEVINILKPKEVLYPVSFAVRKQDYILKNYINLKLLEIEETAKNGVLGIIWGELIAHPEYRHYTLDDVKRYFVRELDRGNQQLGITSGRSDTPEEGRSA